MTVLIVDDLQVVISGIYFGVRWDKIGIDCVHTAMSAQEAKNIFEHHPVDILLCDIDMPGENGLSLFSWVKEQGYDTECIFLTSHDNFIYVKQAFLLGGFDYILQPARYEDIEQAILKIRAHIQEKKQKNQYESYGKMFFTEIEAMKTGLFCSWYDRKFAFCEFVDKLRSIQLSFEADRGFYLLLVKYVDMPEEKQLLDSYLSKYITDYLFPEKYHIIDADIRDFQRLCLIYPDENTVFPCSRFSDCLHSLREHMHSMFHVNAALYADKVSPDKDRLLQSDCAEQALTRIKNASENNVTMKSGVFLSSDAASAMKSKTIPSINTRRLTELLSNGKLEEFSGVCKSFIDTLAQNGGLSSNSLKVFHFTLLQLFYKTLDSLNVPASDIAKTTAEYEKLNHSLRNILDANAFIDDITDILRRFMGTPAADCSDYVDQIIKYIQTHIDDSLKRTDIAAAVYLTPDYVTKIFKDKMNMTLKEYILKEKINIARDRLRTTDLSIEEIALRGGFTNFSYFSQLYKKYTGITPNKERKNKL
ncbi:MAG: response regulator [Lachnospiraceae bacterium]|nr:response regulator [Lachnospiraceae bacterium]